MVKFFSFTIAALLFLSPVTALACACCAEPAHYFSGSTDLDEYPLSQLKRMRFARNASLYLTEAGLEEDAKGIEQPRRNYSVSGSFVKNMLRVTLRAGANAGVLELLLPEKMWQHSADIHDGKLSGGGGPLLYKEWRLEGEVTGTGVFKAATSGSAKYSLLLQGRGNGCDNAEDFTNWRLDVKGEKAEYAFYGKFVQPVTEQ
ncbi:MAG TPA: hypothetical protein VN644_01670 [Pyrinomonadaceae bacterium]|nr:hypothetical protein [Pyrinomonadaceae bacterium]